jgi:hypothetical protein
MERSGVRPPRARRVRRGVPARRPARQAPPADDDPAHHRARAVGARPAA